LPRGSALPPVNQKKQQETFPRSNQSQGKGRVSCEVKSIGATGVKPPLLARTTIYIGTRIIPTAQSYIMNDSDHAPRENLGTGRTERTSSTCDVVLKYASASI